MSDAASPASGTLSRTAQQLTYAADFYDTGNTTDPAGDGSTLQCNAAAPCDDFTLTVNVPDDYAATHPGSKVHVEITWPNDGSDWDLYALDDCDNVLDSSAVRQTPLDDQTEVVEFPAQSGKRTYVIRGVPYAPISTEYEAVVTLTNAGAPPVTPDPDGTSQGACGSGGGSSGASGTITPTTTVQTHDAGPFTASNPAAQGLAGPVCDDTSPCDSYKLTVELPAGYVADHPSAAVKVTLSWTDTGSGASDYDLYVFNGDVPTTDGSQGGNYNSAGGSNPEIASVFPLQDGVRVYTVKSVPFTSTAETVHLRMELFPGGAGTLPQPGPCDSVIFGGPDKTCAGNPRYQMYYAPKGSSAEASFQGEYNIGFNPKTGRILNMNIGPIWRITPAELKPGGLQPPEDSGMPESCPEFWEDVSDPRTDTGLDPILITDWVTGRTFATNSTAGGVALYTDSDGGDPPANDAPNSEWIESGQPPNGGADHETFGSGPLPASLAALVTPVNQGQWVLYCSQDLVAPSMCQKSLTLGTAFENGFPATGLACAGLHGHARIGPDGTAYLPVKSCGDVAGGSLTIDASSSPWTEFRVEKLTADADGPVFTSVPQTNGADPSIGLDADNTIYYCYVNSEANGTEGHVHVAVGKRQPGTTTVKWLRDVDVGKTHGIVNAAHTEAVAGSAGRAACGFIGTNVPGNYQAGDFPGVWYPYVATTYDEGRTWVTVNNAPNDPDQFATGVWQQGGSGQNGNRNLLDFNEITMDDKGRVLHGHSDGCVSASCIVDGTGNDKTAFMRVSRQIGGKTLLAAFDGQTDVAAPLPPKRACLNGSTRDDTTAHLTWRVPDNGGTPITNYDIYRSTAEGGPYTKIATTVDDRPLYNDATAGNSDPILYYVIKANNTAGTSAFSNEAALEITIPPPIENLCILPGITEVTDPVGTGGTAPAGSAGPGMDLLKLSVSQPYSADGIARLIFTIGTDAGVPSQPAGSSWYASFKINDAAGTRYKAVRMTWVGPTPTFESYTPGPNNAGGVDGRFVTAGSQVAAEPNSSYATPFTQVVIVVKASDLGLNPGDVITSFNGAVTQTSSPAPGLPAATATVDEMPNGLAYSGPSYTVVGASFCAPNSPPLVDMFTADPQSGEAPLTVNFSVVAHDPDTNPADTIKTYTFDFGDGSPEVTQPGDTIQHTYEGTGEFLAKVKVTDSRDLLSVNGAETRINVLAEARSAAASVGNNRLGGALPALSLAALALLGLAARYRRSVARRRPPS